MEGVKFSEIRVQIDAKGHIFRHLKDDEHFYFNKHVM